MQIQPAIQCSLALNCLTYHYYLCSRQTHLLAQVVRVAPVVVGMLACSECTEGKGTFL